MANVSWKSALLDHSYVRKDIAPVRANPAPSAPVAPAAASVRAVVSADKNTNQDQTTPGPQIWTHLAGDYSMEEMSGPGTSMMTKTTSGFGSFLSALWASCL